MSTIGKKEFIQKIKQHEKEIEQKAKQQFGTQITPNNIISENQLVNSQLINFGNVNQSYALQELKKEETPIVLKHQLNIRFIINNNNILEIRTDAFARLFKYLDEKQINKYIEFNLKEPIIYYYEINKYKKSYKCPDLIIKPSEIRTKNGDSFPSIIFQDFNGRIYLTYIIGPKILLIQNYGLRQLFFKTSNINDIQVKQSMVNVKRQFKIEYLNNLFEEIYKQYYIEQNVITDDAVFNNTPF